MSSPGQIIGVALERLTQGLRPFFESQFQEVYGVHWKQELGLGNRNDRNHSLPDDGPWDSQFVLAVMWDQWNSVFRRRLGLFERSLVSELREFRNMWAHQAKLTDDDAYRVIDSVQRLLRATLPKDPKVLAILDQLDGMKSDVLRSRLSHEIDDMRRQAKAHQQARTEIALYVIAGLTIILTSMLVIFPKNPGASIILSLFTTMVFAFIIRRRKEEPVAVHGVHECEKCHKVIYREVCPYCETPPQVISLPRELDAAPPLKNPATRSDVLPVDMTP